MNSPTTPNIAPLYISPTLQRLEAGHPSPSPACASCPASMWFATEQLKCFCSRMHVIVWDGVQAPVMVCDGRELALLAIAQEQAEAAERKAAAAQRREDQKLAWKQAAKEIQLEQAQAAPQAGKSGPSPAP